MTSGPANSTRPPATVSVDVDPVDLHLDGYGFRGLVPDPAAYNLALPRLGELFARVGIRATLFVVSRDAAPHAGALRALADQGHEIASHSATHPLALTRLSDAALEHELAGSRAALEAACGAEVSGFRSPNFDMDARVLAALRRAGYRYDASGYPTPVLTAARLLLAIRSRDPLGVLRLRLWPFSWQRVPHRVPAGEGTLEEFPVSVHGPLRLPVYHTARYVMPERSFLAALDALAARGQPLSYPLHAVDVLGLAEDRVDPRLAQHPGMDRPLAAKLELLEHSLRAIVARFEPRTFRERVAG
jgi:hypothetical protein